MAKQMNKHSKKSPLTQLQLIDQYFLENRNRLLDVAAFLDRLKRASKKDGQNDFRLIAFKKVLKILPSDQSSYLKKALMILSDPTQVPLPKLDRKSALGAYNPKGGKK